MFITVQNIQKKLDIGKWNLQIQIRTAEMHEASEYGIAAHWLYKEQGNSKGKMSSEDKLIDSTPISFAIATVPS